MGGLPPKSLRQRFKDEGGRGAAALRRRVLRYTCGDILGTYHHRGAPIRYGLDGLVTVWMGHGDTESGLSRLGICYGMQAMGYLMKSSACRVHYG